MRTESRVLELSGVTRWFRDGTTCDFINKARRRGGNHLVYNRTGNHVENTTAAREKCQSPEIRSQMLMNNKCSVTTELTEISNRLETSGRMRSFVYKLYIYFFSFSQ